MSWKPSQKGIEKGEMLLSLIYDEVDRRLNPEGEECPYCGGEGQTFECFDGCCAAAEIGCSYCTRPCIECRIFAGQRARAIREEVIRSGDVELAVAWLKSVGRWRPGISRAEILSELQMAREKLEASYVEPRGEVS